jgi:hypothetical protein
MAVMYRQAGHFCAPRSRARRGWTTASGAESENGWPGGEHRMVVAPPRHTAACVPGPAMPRPPQRGADDAKGANQLDSYTVGIVELQ